MYPFRLLERSYGVLEFVLKCDFVQLGSDFSDTNSFAYVILPKILL